MRLSVKGLTITSALLWGGGLLFAGAMNLRYPWYARRYLKLMSSVYPGYKNSRAFKDVLVGSAYASLDGALAGLLFGWLYNTIAERERAHTLGTETRAA